MAIKADAVTFGCDPEVAVINRKTGKVIPAWELVNAQKGQEPLDIGNGVSIHADGTALEFNIEPQRYNRFTAVVRRAVQQVQDYANTAAATKGLTVDICTFPETQEYDKKTLAHPLANVDGCDPDYCAYGDDPTIPRVRESVAATPYRYFGGHIHVGYDVAVCPPWAMARMFDLFVYAPNAHLDKQPHRKKLFGLAGLYRPKPYGFEYRTPSNFWLFSDVAADHMAYNMRSVLRAFEQNPTRVNDGFNEIDWNKTQTFLNKSDISDQDCIDFYKKEIHALSAKLGIGISASYL